jgi:metal-responsive CopG/Arc/MetJ family transcriptional regulator
VDVYSYGDLSIVTTIQMTLEEDLLKEMDRTVKKLGTTRSALIRDSIRQYLKMIHVRQLEAKHRAGYAKHPVLKGEFDVPESDRSWSE